METIAIYWEPVIKTYGILERAGLSLITLPISKAGSDAGATAFLEAAASWDNVKIVFAASGVSDGLRLGIVVDGPPTTIALPASPPAGLKIDAPVDLVYFQGPHFGDRYGIAETALGALESSAIPVIAMVCAGASVYLVVADGSAHRATQALCQLFAGPASVEKGPES